MVLDEEIDHGEKRESEIVYVTGNGVWIDFEGEGYPFQWEGSVEFLVHMLINSPLPVPAFRVRHVSPFVQ